MSVILILAFGSWDLHLVPMFILVQIQRKNASKKEGYCFLFLRTMKTAWGRNVQDQLLLAWGLMVREVVSLVKAGPTDSSRRQAGEGARSTCRTLETKHFQSIN